MGHVINIQELDQYPDNYDGLSGEDQAIILGYMNGMQALANRYYREYMDHIEDHIDTGKYIRQYNHTITSLTGSKNAYATLGIMVEYNWPGYKGLWVLATREMAETYRNDEIDENEIPENYNILLDYSDIGH